MLSELVQAKQSLKSFSETFYKNINGLKIECSQPVDESNGPLMSELELQSENHLVNLAALPAHQLLFPSQLPGYREFIGHLRVYFRQLEKWIDFFSDDIVPEDLGAPFETVDFFPHYFKGFEENVGFAGGLEIEAFIQQSLKIIQQIEANTLERISVLEDLVPQLEEKGFLRHNTIEYRKWQSPFSLKVVEAGKQYLLDQKDIEAQLLSLKEDYAKLGLLFEFSLPANPKVVAAEKQKYSNVCALFDRFDDLEQRASNAGWLKTWSPTQRQRGDIEKESALVAEQISLSKNYATLRNFARSIGENCPKYEFPFLASDLDAFNEHLEFIDRWTRQMDDVRYRTLPWQRHELPPAPKSPTPESVTLYVEQTRDLVTRGRLWYASMTPFRWIGGIVRHVRYQLRDLEVGWQLERLLEHWPVSWDFTCGTLIALALLCGGFLSNC